MPKIVYYLGPSYGLVDYGQQIGRAGRGTDMLSHAILYNFNKGNSNISKSMKNYLYLQLKKCLCVLLYSQFNDSTEQLYIS